MRNKRKLIYIAILVMICCSLTIYMRFNDKEGQDRSLRSTSSTHSNSEVISEQPTNEFVTTTNEFVTTNNEFVTTNKEPSLINPDGVIIKERFLPIEGYSRIETESGSFAEFLQTLPLKPDGSKVRYYDGSIKTKDVYLAVVDYTLGDRDLQQCADAVMRLRAEYLYAAGKLNDIRFDFVSGFTADFSKWAAGYGISVNGNDVSWVQNNQNDDSYESFQKYLDVVYTYANTHSLEQELVSKDISEIAIGDVFIIGGFPGHCVIIVDMLINEGTGEKVFMLAQSYMPAQDIQILKCDTDESPWYTANIIDRLITPEWTFEKTNLRTWQ